MPTKNTKKTTNVDNYTRGTANDGMNLAGTDNIRNSVGTVRETRGNTSTATSSYSNALGTPKKVETPKSDFTTSSTNTKANISTKEVKTNLSKNQKTLSSVADESNQKAKAFFNKVGETFAYDKNKVDPFISPEVKKSRERELSLNTSDFIAPEVKLAQQKTEMDNARSTEILLNGGESKGVSLTDEAINKLPSVLIDQRTGMEVDQNYVGNLYDDVNNNYNYVKNMVDNLNNNYKKGLVNDEDYKKLYSEYSKMWDSNKKDADELSNYQYLSGRKYYDWLKENGTEDDIKSFEALVGSYDDNPFESLLNSWKATQVDTISRPFQVYSMIRATMDENYDYNDPDNISSQLNSVSEELRSYCYNGKNGEGFRYYSLQTINSLMPMINDAITGTVIMGSMGLESKALEGAVGAFTNVEMGIGSAEQTFRQRLSEGNSPDVAFGNALAHGVVTAMVEALNMGNIGNVVSLFNGPAKTVLGVGLMSLPNFLQIAKNTAGDAFGEGMEEIWETVLTSAVDYATNIVLSNFTDQKVNLAPIEIGGIGDGGLTDQFIMASAGSVLLGGATNAKLTVDSIKKYNASGQASIFWQKYGDYYRSIGENENARACDFMINLIENERKTYYDLSVVKDSVQTAEDIATPAPSVEDVLNMIANGFRADVSNQFEVNDQQVREGTDILNRLQNEYNNRGYSNKMDFGTYLNSNNDIRNASKKIMDFADAIGSDVRITDNFVYEKDGRLFSHSMADNENGVAVLGDTVVVNPYASDFAVNGGGEAMIKTFAHELTHTTEKTGAYNDLKESVIQALGKEWDVQYESIKNLYEKNGQRLTKDGIEKEIVAKYIENNIGNESFLQTLSDYNSSLFTKVYSGMKAMMSVDPNAKVAQDFFRAYNERITSAMNSSVPTNVFGDMISANDCQFNIAQYQERGKNVLRDYLDKQIQKGALTQEDADGIAETLDFYANQIEGFLDGSKFKNFAKWSTVSMTQDHDGYPQLTCVVANGDYKMNIDFSTVCKKRKVADAVFNEIAREGLLDKRALSETDIATIRDIVKRNGLEVACSLCFVDSKRFKQGGWAETLVNGKEDKIDKKLVSLGVQNKQGHIMGWNEMVDVLANDPSEIGDFNFANRTETNEGTLHTLSDSEVNQKGLRFLKKVAKNTSTQSEVGKIARALLNNPELRKHMLLGDLYASEAFGNIKRGNQDLFKIVNTHQGVAKPKSPYVEVTYNNEIITSPTFNSEKARDVGGVRIQSFSDYMANMAFDYMEMVAELQAKDLTAHSYTKVQDFAELFGQTGIKINLSIIPKATTLTPQELNSLSDVEKAEVKQYAGLERFSLEDVQNMKASEREKLINERGLSLSEDGSCYTAYIFEDESFNWLDALELQSREGYDRNVGTICVGVSDEHILKMMNDDNVKMIIPYHKSSLNPMVAHMMNISAYNDYTDSQNTRVLKNGEWVSIGSTKQNDFSFYSDRNGMINNGYDAKATSQAYLNWCAKNGHLPKFDQFAYVEDANGDWIQNENGSYSYVGEGNGNLSVNENYYKVLIDFRAYDNNGNIAPQESVRQSYPEDFMEKLKSSLTTYEELTNKQKRLLPKVVRQVRTELQNNDLQNSYSLSDEYDVAVRNNDIGRAENIVRQYAQNYARETGQQVFEGFHGTNAKFNQFLKSKLGSKNFLADSAYKAFFMAGSENTARNYTGLNQADMFNLNFDSNMQGERQRIIEKYDLENLRSQRNEERTNYINNVLENIISQDTPTGRNGLPDVTANMIKRLRENGVDGFTAEQISNLENSLRDQWLAENNDIYREYESNSELYKRLEEAEKQAGKEYEQLGIDYLGYEPNIKHLFAFMSNPLVHDFKNEGRDVDFTALIDEAKENGNDGVIFQNVKDGGDFDTIYAVFEPNQFKSADAITYDDNGNVIPLSERFNQGTDDLRYSISDTDNDGNKLSRQQREYFKNSKVVDENGNLLKVYHGTNAVFSIFDPRKFGNNEAIAEGFGIYLTDNKDVAKSYGNKLMESYANITNPASSNSKTIDINTLERLIERTVEIEAEQMVASGEYDSLEEAKRDSWISNYIYTHDNSMNENYRETAETILKLNNNDMDIIREVMAGMGIRDYQDAYEFYDTLKETTGIDGFETTWENKENPNNPVRVFVALDSSQIKNVNNTNPTTNPDIQYSLGGTKGLDNLWVNGNEEDINNYDKAMQLRDEANKMRAELNADGTRKYTEDDIRKKTGWFVPEYESNKTKDRFEFYDDGTIGKLADYVDGEKGIGNSYLRVATIMKQPTIKDVIGDDGLLFKMYPELANVRIEVVNRRGQRAGGYVNDKHGRFVLILVNKKNDLGVPFTRKDYLNTIAHEIQHYIQDIEGFEYDYGKHSYREKPGEIESFDVGSKQENPASRQYDMFGDTMSLDGEQIFNNTEGSGENIGNQDESSDIIPDSDETLITDFEDGENGQNTSGNSGGNFESSVDDEQEAEDNILTVSDTDIPVSTKSPNTGDFSSNKIAQVLSEKPTAETAKERWERIKRIAKHELIDHLDAVRELARQYRNPRINAKADFAMLAPNMAYQTLVNKRTELRTNKVIGKSLNEIYGKLPQDQKQLFDEYMYHWRNVDSTSVENRLGDEYKNKYVFGESIGTDESLQRIAEIEREHPEYKQIAEDIWEYTRQNLQMLVDGGIISKQQYDNFQKATPHYVPISRNVEGGTGVSSTDPNKAIKRFKGSTIDILPLEGSLIKQTQNIYRSVLSNSLHNEIFDTLGNASGVASEDIETVLDNGFNPLDVDPNGGKHLYAYRNGQKFSMPISEELYNSLSPRKNPYNMPDSKALQSVSEFRRNLITGWNPLFMITNAIKDIQDAGFNTKYPKQFLPNFVEAWAQILSNGEYKQLYVANGGSGNSYINELGDAKLKGNNPFTKAFNAVVSANEAVEMAPRLAEFISTLRDGKSIEEAMYNASEITTNFKRGGDTAKYFNRNGMAFLNASIQGFDKQMRNIQDAKDGGTKAMLTYMAKVALAGMPLYILNHLMWKDDDDYEELSDYVKDNYYIIKKYGDGKFIRIPKGRIASFIQTVLENGVNTVKGEAKIWDALLDDLQSFMDNVAPNNPIENFIATPLIDAMNNRAWYGGDLLPTRLQDVPDSEQYDESTDALSIAIGNLSKRISDATGMDFLELSPYKLNYVIDQYSGAIGDIVLPMITPETTSDVNNPILKGVTAPVLDKFTTDSVLKNENVTQFYALRDEINKLSNSVNATDEQILASKYLYSISSEMGKLYAEEHRIQADTSLTNKEKYEQSREIKKQINELAKTGLANYDQIDIKDNYANVGGVNYYKKSDGSWTKPSSSTLEKASGLSMEDSSAYFETFGEITDIRNRIKANTPEGQTANYTRETIDAISKSKMSYAGKNALYDSYYDSKVTNHINAMDLTDEQKYNLKIANKLAEGTKDENGKTVANSKAQAVADAYDRLGLLDDVIKYIQDNDLSPSELGLSKTVYNQLLGSTSYKDAYAKTMRSSKKSSKKKKTSTSGVGSNSISKAGKVKTAQASFSRPEETEKVANNYLSAYASMMRRGSGNVSTGGSTQVVCPRCGNKVYSSSGRCPICGNTL